jgi:eukaryotic-like serine/threonine-protein kinase
VSAEHQIVPGDVLVQKYRVDRVLGHGGMGVVFAAKHLGLGERVAIKVLSRSACEDRDALARLQREARILARVRNEHVVHVIDLGELENGTPFIVMEHLIGRDLGNLLEEQGRLAPERAVDFVLQACVALAAAHANSVVHRDLKPDNLFCVSRDDGAPLIKVLDFGISRFESSSEESALRFSVTSTNTVLGTPLYMSPEQLRNSKRLDARSDIWSIGVVLYELLAGFPPFSGHSFGDVAIRIATETPTALTELDPPVDPELAAVVLRCLEKDREQRFANVGELGKALQPFGPIGSEAMIARIEGILARAPSGTIDTDDARLTESEALVPPPSPALASLSPTRATAPSRLPFVLRRVFGSVPLRVAAGMSAIAVLFLAFRYGKPSKLELAEQSTSLELNRAAPSTVAPAHSVSTSQSAPASLAGEVFAPHVAPARPAGTAEALSRRTSRAPRMTGTAPPKDSCNPPYTLDAQGRKKFRHECFTDPRAR